MTQSPDDDLTRRVIDCVMEVFSQTGPGLPKEVYEACVAVELAAAGLPFESGRVLNAAHEGHAMDFRCETDLIVANSLLLQIEAADAIEAIHEQKLRTCLWMGGFPSGLLLNFNVEDMDDGIVRVPCRQPDKRPLIHDVFDDPDIGVAF